MEIGNLVLQSNSLFNWNRKKQTKKYMTWLDFLPLLPADGNGMVANKKRPMGTTTDLKTKADIIH